MGSVSSKAEYLREYRRENKDRLAYNDWAAKLVKLYGITATDYFTMLDQQGGVCGLCGRAPRPGKRLAVDHCHTTGSVRGLLCTNCNTALGSLGDDEDGLTRALEWTRRTYVPKE